MPIANITLDCVNGISKQDAETLKALPETLEAIEDSIGDADTEIEGIKDSIGGLDDRVTALETEIEAGNNWELFEGTDWSDLVDADGNLIDDVLIRISIYLSYEGGSYPIQNEYVMYKGTRLSSLTTPYNNTFIRYENEAPSNKPLVITRVISHTAQDISQTTIELSYVRLILKSGSSTWTSESGPKTLNKNPSTSVNSIRLFTH